MDAADVAGVGPLGVAAGNTLSRIPLVPEHLRTDSVRTVSTPDIRDSEPRNTC